MTIATGVATLVAYKKESAWGSAAGATGATYLRRVTSDLAFSKETFQSSEIRSDYQIADFRHGMRRVGGTVKGELSPGSYAPFVAAALRRDFTAVTPLSAGTDVTAAATSPHFVDASAGWLAAGFKVGMVVRFTGFTATANNGKNFLITALTAGNMTGVFLNGDAVTAENAGHSITVTPVGKVTYTPTTGHTNDSYTIEHYYSDVAKSEYFTGCRVSSLGFGLSPTAMASIDVGFMGKDMPAPSSSAYFTTPGAASATGILAGPNGYVSIAGSPMTALTGLTINVAGGHSVGATIGSNLTPDVFAGRVNVSGQLTAYFDSTTLRDYFLDETAVNVTILLTTGTTATADFISLVMPACKFGGATKADGEQGVVVTLPFQAIYNAAGGSSTDSEKTTLWIQDSAAV